MRSAGAERPVLVILAAGMATRFGGGCKPLAPLGLHGEAVIDMTAGDALASGFGDVVVVVGPASGPAIEYHVRRAWPEVVDVQMAQQSVPLGTAHAALCARRFVGARPFAVVNGDDVYGRPAFAALAAHLLVGRESALVAFALGDTVVTDEPVTRGTCNVSSSGELRAIAERKLVSRRRDGTFTCEDGATPIELEPATPVSMNLWGLLPDLWTVLEEAVRKHHSEVAPDGSVEGDVEHDGGEVLLPEVIGDFVNSSSSPAERQVVRVLEAKGRCIGVTHAEDLPVARNALATMVARGERPESPWEGVS